MTKLSEMFPGGSGGLTWQTVSSNTSAEANNGYIMNGASNTVTLTLPASPSDGDTVGVKALDNTNQLKVARNGKKIEGQEEDLILDVEGAGFTFVYSGSTKGWVIVSEINSGGTVSAVANAIFRDEKTSGTPGGTFTSGAWQTRVLNTEATNGISGCSLVSNQITLPAGNYLITGWGCANQVGENQLRLYNTSDSAVEAVGLSLRTDAVGQTVVAMLPTVFVTIVSDKTFELQHRCLTTRNTDGFGDQNSWGDGECYAELFMVMLRKKTQVL